MSTGLPPAQRPEGFLTSGRGARATTPELFSPTERAERRFWEFFTAHIRNPNTRLAYLTAARRFACSSTGSSSVRSCRLTPRVRCAVTGQCRPLRFAGGHTAGGEWEGLRSEGSVANLSKRRGWSGRGRCSPHVSALAKWSCSQTMAPGRAHGPIPKARSPILASPMMPSCRAKTRAWPLRSARITSKPLIVA